MDKYTLYWNKYSIIQTADNVKCISNGKKKHLLPAKCHCDCILHFESDDSARGMQQQVHWGQSSRAVLAHLEQDYG